MTAARYSTACAAKTVRGPSAVLLVCQLPAGHEGPHSCRLTRPGGPLVQTWTG